MSAENLQVAWPEKRLKFIAPLRNERAGATSENISITWDLKTFTRGPAKDYRAESLILQMMTIQAVAHQMCSTTGMLLLRKTSSLPSQGD